MSYYDVYTGTNEKSRERFSFGYIEREMLKNECDEGL